MICMLFKVEQGWKVRFFLKDQFFCIVPSIFVCVWLDIFSGENLVLQVSFGWFYGESSIFCKGYHALDKSASLRTKNKTIFKNESFQNVCETWEYVTTNISKKTA